MDIGMYERQLKSTGAVVARIARDQFDASTPCTDWNVRDLLNHLIGGLETFASGAKGTAVDMDANDHCAEDHVAAYERASKGALEAFSAPGAMERKFKLPWGDTPGSVVFGLALADAAVHGWDLAKATDQEIAIDDAAAEAVYAMTSQMMEPKGSYPRGDNFAAPVDVAGDAPPADRMIAYLGRRP